MNLYNLLRTTLISLSKNRFRTFLTMLGIIIGIASVIIIQSFGKGAEAYINSKIASLGTNIITISPKAAKANGVTLDAGSLLNLRISDISMIDTFCRSVKHISPVLRISSQLKYGSNNWRTGLLGVSPDYLHIRSLEIESGAPFNDDDIKASAKVCLIGLTVKQNLFGNDQFPIGKIIRVGMVPFRVIGVLKSKGESTFGNDQDDVILAPYSAAKSRITGSEFIQQIFVSAINDGKVNDAVKEIVACLRVSHGIPDSAVSKFSVSTQAELTKTAGSITGAITLLLSGIAAISLIVGGTGIMNIMFVSVRERTREIGIRLSVGASAFDILLQFLLEAVTVTLLAGAIGVVLGASVSWVFSIYANFQLIVSAYSILSAFCVCSVIGVFCGWYPARKAARVNPIESLKFE
jgi:putative ABC transport system permease protein